MKTKLALICCVLGFAANNVSAQDNNGEKLGLPGDNLNLAAVLDVFQHSPTLESFEAALNADTSKINNLDLNNDNFVDYIKVLDKKEGDVHTIILQVDVADKESQDVAVIFVEKKGNEVNVQMIGDEDLYGKDYILEPSSDGAKSSTPNPAYTKDEKTTVVNNYYYNTDNNYYSERPNYCPPPDSWLIIGFIYGPHYNPWHSPFYWGYYPGWYHPWTPWYYDNYYNHWYYQHSWNGWWYWRAHHNHFNVWYGPYRSNRHASGLYLRNRTSGVYNRTYKNPQPAPRPAGKARFPSHALNTDKNPAIVKPGAGAVRPATPQKNIPVRKIESPKKHIEQAPSKPGQEMQTKPGNKIPVAPSKEIQKKPASKPIIQEKGKTAPPARPAAPVKKPTTIKPAQPVKDKPGTSDKRR